MKKSKLIEQLNNLVNRVDECSSSKIIHSLYKELYSFINENKNIKNFYQGNLDKFYNYTQSDNYINDYKNLANNIRKLIDENFNEDINIFFPLFPDLVSDFDCNKYFDKGLINFYIFMLDTAKYSQNHDFEETKIYKNNYCIYWDINKWNIPKEFFNFDYFVFDMFCNNNFDYCKFGKLIPELDLMVSAEDIKQLDNYISLLKIVINKIISDIINLLSENKTNNLNIQKQYLTKKEKTIKEFLDRNKEFNINELIKYAHINGKNKTKIAQNYISNIRIKCNYEIENISNNDYIVKD